MLGNNLKNQEGDDGFVVVNEQKRRGNAFKVLQESGSSSDEDGFEISDKEEVKVSEKEELKSSEME